MEILNMDTVLQTEESFNEDIKSNKRKYEQDEPEDDEVVWIPKPKPKIELEIGLESNQSDKKEVVFIGETNNPLSTMPHPRHLCINHPFSLFNKNKNNHKTCSNCYCFVCDVPAISCKDWEVHQNAHDDESWNGIKKERNLLLSFNLGDPNPDYPGVAFSSSKKKWRASYFWNGGRSNVHIGFYKTEKEALHKSLKYSFRYKQLENKNDRGASWDEDSQKWKATNYFQKELLDLPECWYASQSEAINKSLLESFNIKKKKGLISHSRWKPFHCPIINCNKRYVYQRPCANHPARLCYHQDRLAGKRFRCPIMNCNYGDNSQKRCVFHPKFLCYEPKDYID